MKNRLWTRLVALFMALAVALTFAAPAYAATSKTVAKQGFTTTTKTIKKKATTVKKGTTKLTYKKGQGYIRFKAPATKTYNFTFSGVTSKAFTSNAYVTVQKPDTYSPKYSFDVEVKTKGGKAATLWLNANGYKDLSNRGTNKCLNSRTATIKLKKGQEIYFYFSAGTNAKTNAKVVIK